MFLLAYHFFWSIPLVFLWPVSGLMRLGFHRPGHGSGLQRRLGERLGWAISEAPPCPAGSIWVHALSVGEVISAIPLVDRLKEEFPERKVVITAATSAGLAVAEEKLSSRVHRIIPMPVDAWWATRRLVDLVKPSIYILVETDIWPGLLALLKQRGIKSILVNGRISPRTFRAYKNGAFLIRRAFDPISACLMQSDPDRERLISVGIDKKKVIATGNIKFDRRIEPMGREERGWWQEILGLRPDDPVWVAGSTHSGEEEVIFQVFEELKASFPRLCLIVAPRDTGRAAEVAAMAQARGLRPVLKTRISNRRDAKNRVNDDLIIVDTMGELGRIYGIGAVSFVGGSLVPVGGHNPLEPAAFGIPVLFGLHTHNFVAMSEGLVEAGGGRQVADGRELAATLRAFLRDEAMRARAGAKASAFVEKNQGATERVIWHVKQCMGYGA